ncbi:hypothetical protein [Steroidobacter denitrificans]|uniref:hypothetical protein n=1 Tax=Steroidobacter denitrificans TaxID=465721 RepID=UPI0012ECBE47|nr:hypothetical protein [Steroidobacter denitrificans]
MMKVTAVEALSDARLRVTLASSKAFPVARFNEWMKRNGLSAAQAARAISVGRYRQGRAQGRLPRRKSGWPSKVEQCILTK